MGLIPVFVSLVFYGHLTWALVVFLIAGLSDGIDGFIARRFGQVSELGTIIDPVADKLLMTSAFIILSLPKVMPVARHLPIPFWVTAAVVGRDILILTVAAAITIITGFRGFRPSFLGKLSTFVQVAAVILILIGAITGQTVFLPTVYFIVVLLAVVSGLHYIVQVARLMKEAEKPLAKDS
jgi:cardiolipin synthase